MRKETDIPESEIDEIIEMLDPKKIGYVNSKPYIDMLRSMCSYLATDINHDHTIEAKELNTLLWLIEGIEPTKKRVKEELAVMDVNSDGTISLIEWIKYLCNVDSVVSLKY